MRKNKKPSMKYSLLKNNKKIIVLNHLKKYIDEFSKKNSNLIFKYYNLPLKIYDNKKNIIFTKSGFINYFNLVHFFLRQQKYKFTKIIYINVKINKTIYKVNLQAKRFFKKKEQKLKLIYSVIIVKNKPKIVGFRVINDS